MKGKPAASSVLHADDKNESPRGRGSGPLGPRQQEGLQLCELVDQQVGNHFLLIILKVIAHYQLDESFLAISVVALPSFGLALLLVGTLANLRVYPLCPLAVHLAEVDASVTTHAGSMSFAVPGLEKARVCVATV